MAPTTTTATETEIAMKTEFLERRELAPDVSDGVPSTSELVERAEALRERLWEDAAGIDEQRRLTDRVVEGITAAGLTRLMAPRVHGGYESGVRAVLDVVTELGRGCASSAWVTGVFNSGNFVVGLFDRAARADVWSGNPDARVALVLVPPKASAERVAGGLRVSGTWGYASGSLHCDWLGLLVPVPTDSGDTEMNMMLVPRDHVRVEDTWFVTGLRGTGTNTVVLDEVVVPEHRVQPYGPLVEGARPHERPGESLYRSSVSGVLQVFLLGAMIGEARSALDVVLEKAPRRSIASSTYASQLDSTPFQVDVAEAAATIDGAAMHAARIADVVDAAAASGEELDVPARARMRMDAAAAVRGAREAVDQLMTAHGTSAFAEVSPLQRIWRNVHVGSRHGGFGSHIPEEVYGKALLGLDPRAASYLL